MVPGKTRYLFSIGHAMFPGQQGFPASKIFRPAVFWGPGFACDANFVHLWSLPMTWFSDPKSLLGVAQFCCVWVVVGLVVQADEVIPLNGHHFTVAEGMQIELAANSQLCPRPITASFDEEGVLYVADSSGSNDPVKQQLENPSHRILRLTDRDGDGQFDASSVFADRMMFPEGTLWYQGSLYVAAPPQIWKLTDTDADGVADLREVWFDGKTLTGCANDLHGPYLGRDGWIYWCKGAFAEQHYQRKDGNRWSTRAAHVFRRHPSGGEVEAVMTGGMDNPVDVVMTPGGEKIFTTTFLTHPGDGNRDGLIHAIYGGVYGKDHGVLQGHARTGELLPPLTHLGAAAPSGLELVEGANVTSAEGHLLLTCSFNLHKVFWHPLSFKGSRLHAPARDLVVSDQLDFHPTDVVQAPDGSWLILDTGGWYKLCCPTSQLVKPDVLGGIYRVSAKDTPSVKDPLGQALDWAPKSPGALIERFDDPRLFVRRRAIEQVAMFGEDAIADLQVALNQTDRPRLRLNAIWCLSHIPGDAARRAARVGLRDALPVVRQATLHTIALHRDVESAAVIMEQLLHWRPATQRVACEALGRLGRKEATTPLLNLADQASDRMLEHSIVYALIELDDPSTLTKALADPQPGVQRAAAIALDQLAVSAPVQRWVLEHLGHPDERREKTAEWILTQHPEWGGQLAERVSDWLDQMAAQQTLVERFRPWLGNQLKSEAATRSVVEWMQRQVGETGWTPRVWLPLQLAPPEGFDQELIAVLKQGMVEASSEALLPMWDWLSQSNGGLSAEPEICKSLDQKIFNSKVPDEIRKTVALARFKSEVSLPEDLFSAILQDLQIQQNPAVRQNALRLLQQWPLDEGQRAHLVGWLDRVPATEVTILLSLFKGGEDADTGLALVQHLQELEAYRWVPESNVRETLASYDEEVNLAAEELWKAYLGQRAEQVAKLEALLEELPEGNVRRGQQLFHEQKTQCISCHQMGYLGGKLGPDLTRIGGIRQTRDLLEAIVFPSISFVRSYEPKLVTTADGRQIQGLIVEQDDESVTLALDSQRTERVMRDDIDDMAAGRVSLMPSGFDQQLNLQELADLVEFLKASR